MKVCFMGSMDFAVKILESLNQHHQVALVVTQPDKPVGRKRIMKGTPVKERALALGLDIYQPENIKRDHQKIINQSFDFIVVAAYGQMIPDDILYHAKYQAINVHASLLPKYRGGTPMHRAIINGDEFSGVSIMYMIKKMDAGDILNQVKIQIDKDDDVATLESKLAEKGASLLIETMSKMINGTAVSKPQDINQVTYAYHIKPEEQIIDINHSAFQCYNLVRGMYPWPIAELYVNQQRVKIFKAAYSDENTSYQVGTVVKIDQTGVFIQTKNGLFIIKELQVNGKKRMDIHSFMNGAGKSLFQLYHAI